MKNQDKYRLLCKSEESIPIFSQAFWLDAICGMNNWDVLLYENENQIIGALPYFIKKRCGLSYITQPQFTQTMGVWIKYPPNQKYEKKLSYEKVVMTALIEQLEKLPICFYQQSFSYTVTNWLPFFWKGFHQTTKYTYRIEDIGDTDRVFKNFSHAKRKNINKALAEKVIIGFDLSAEEFYENHSYTLNLQNQRIGYSFKLLENIYNAIYQNDAGRVIYARDMNGNLHGALLVTWDKQSGYNLISTIDPTYRNSGSASLLIYEIIKFLSNKVKSFDFEGSMIEGVENSFRQFGSTQTPYFFINKIYSKNPFVRYVIRKMLR